MIVRQHGKNDGRAKTKINVPKALIKAPDTLAEFAHHGHILNSAPLPRLAPSCSRLRSILRIKRISKILLGSTCVVSPGPGNTDAGNKMREFTLLLCEPRSLFFTRRTNNSIIVCKKSNKFEAECMQKRNLKVR